MRVVVERSTGRILEAQPAAKPGVMLANIVAGGAYRANELIEVDDPLAPPDISSRVYSGGTWVLRPEIAAEVTAKPIKAKIAELEAETGFSRKQREVLIAGLPQCPLRVQLAALDDRVAAERVKLPPELRGVRAGG